MRLIDADELMEEIKPLKIVLNGKSILNDDAKDTILRIIDEQPTVYDIDKVVEELEEIINPKYFYFCRVSKGKCNRLNDDIDCLDCALLNAIEIVKAGGKK